MIQSQISGYWNDKFVSCLSKRKNPREKEVRKPGGAVNVAMI